MAPNMTVPQSFHDVTMGQAGQNSTTLMRVPQSHNTATMGQFMSVPQSHVTATIGHSDHESTTVTWYCYHDTIRS